MTALMQMAAARPPGVADARVPCPLCGGLIHPVAGRCKHCKEDLSTYRSGRAAAAAALPALNARPAATNGSNGHVVATASAVPVVVARQESQPILPPRTTARSVPVARPHSVWRSWPMMVIVLAVAAIVAATVIMVMPAGAKHKDGKMSAPPAPERMETNPMPDKSSQLDPWDNGPANPAPAPPAAPKPPDPDDTDIWGGTGGTPGGGGLGGNPFGGGGNGTAFMVTILERACKKLKSCPDADQSSLTVICDQVAMMPKSKQPSCAAAQKCLDAIDKMSCTSAANASPMSMFTLIDACGEAANC